MSVRRDGNTWLTKLERISELAQHDHELVFNNLAHVIDKALLMKQYRKIDGKKAIGVDGVSKDEYGKGLEVNITKLLEKIRLDKYRPQPARIVMIPKEDGSERPLAISCFEDKLVQSAISEILEQVYEPIFLPCSYGFRPSKSAHEALRELNKLTYSFTKGAVVEIDIRKYFNTIPHQELRKFLTKKISDRKFLRLLQRLVEAPIIENGTTTINKQGCPQGSIVSPILANIYLHYVIDEWFEETRKQHLCGKAGMVRYADDMVFAFEIEQDAIRFYRTLPKRLNKYGLVMHENKSQIVKSGKYHAATAAAKGEKLKSYKFLGFTCYWGKSRHGTMWRLKYRSRGDRFTAKLKGLRKYLRSKLVSKDKMAVLSTVTRMTRGWINYHTISDNQRRVSAFVYHSKHIIFAWLNRMGGKKRINWKRFNLVLQRIAYPEKWKVISMFPTPNKYKTI